MRVPWIAAVAAVGGALLVPAVPLAEDPPKPPAATLDAASEEVRAGHAIELDSSRSTPGDAPIAGHVWDLDGDGSFETDSGADPKVDAKPETPGPLTVRVRVVDGAGQQADASLDLTVTAPPPKMVDSEPGSDSYGGQKDPADPPAPADEAPQASADDPAPPAEPSPQPEPQRQPEPQPSLPQPSPARLAGAQALQPRQSLTTTTAVYTKKKTATVRAAAASSVTIKDFKFAPASITVHEGDTITWTNQDIAPHTATASDGSFDTGNISKGNSGSATFSKAGTIPYICSIHPNMKGTVVVEAAAGGGSGSGSGGSDDSAAAGGENDSGGLPQTGLNLAAVVLLACLMVGSGTLLRRRVG